MLVSLQKSLLKHTTIFVSGLCAGGLLVGFMISATSHADTGVNRNILKMLKEENQQILELKNKSSLTFQALVQKLGEAHAQIALLEGRLQHLAKDLGLTLAEVRPEGLGNLQSMDKMDTHIFENISSLEHRLLQHARQIGAIEELAQLKKIEGLTVPKGEFQQIAKGWVSSFFGFRKDPFSGQQKWHSGVDIACEPGMQVNAIATGVVTFAGIKGGYGNLLEINHGQGLVTRYGHNASLLVKEGDLVHKGTPIALAGETGRATAPHVHFEVREHGAAVDPAKYLPGVTKKQA